MVKVCGKCDEVKPVAEFYGISKDSEDLRGACKPCTILGVVGRSAGLAGSCGVAGCVACPYRRGGKLRSDFGFRSCSFHGGSGALSLCGCRICSGKRSGELYSYDHPHVTARDGGKAWGECFFYLVDMVAGGERWYTYGISKDVVRRVGSYGLAADKAALVEVVVVSRLMANCAEAYIQAEAPGLKYRPAERISGTVSESLEFSRESVDVWLDAAAWAEVGAGSDGVDVALARRWNILGAAV